MTVDDASVKLSPVNIYIFTSAINLFYVVRNTWQPVVDEMALLKYFSVKNPPAALPTKVSFVSQRAPGSKLQHSEDNRTKIYFRQTREIQLLHGRREGNDR